MRGGEKDAGALEEQAVKALAEDLAAVFQNDCLGTGEAARALNMAEYAAIKGKKAVAVFSMEMSASQLAFRLISSLGRINQQHLRTGELEDADWPRVTSAIQLLKDAKIFIDDTPALSPTDLRARARRLKREHDLGLIVIDYLQLMAVPGTRENRATEISEISRSLKALAKELNVPVIALSQLNRSLEQRPNKRPVMSDLRESGVIEQDADVMGANVDADGDCIGTNFAPVL